MTLTRYRAHDGSGAIIQTHRLNSGFVVAVTGLEAAGAGRSHAPMFIRAGEVAIFPAHIAGRRCSIIVCPDLKRSTDHAVEAAMPSDRETFTRAAEHYPNQGLIGLAIDRPSSELTAGTPASVKALTTRMLMSSLLTAAR